ncbi:MAG: hypothetical protein M1816_001366 [Peltula sp. TS41687]|nr:MAG: hypothetical protein M1816_001366 [Peltula sp. TS41687]
MSSTQGKGRRKRDWFKRRSYSGAAQPSSSDTTLAVIETRKPTQRPIQSLAASSLHALRPKSASPQRIGSSAGDSQALHHGVVPDLWAEALRDLSNTEREAMERALVGLQKRQESTIDILQQISAMVEQKQEQCVEKRWKFNFNGQVVILRDVAGKVIMWINKFKDIGDFVMAFDQVHLALPWAGVKTLLSVWTSTDVDVGDEQMGSLLMRVEITTRLINRCKIYEAYLHAVLVNPASTNLRSSLVKLYTAILRFLAKANQLLDKNTGRRAVYAFLRPNIVADFVKQCSELGEEVDTDARNCWQEYNVAILEQLGTAGHQLQRYLEDLHQPVIRIDSKVANLWDISHRSEQSDILRWISSIPFEENHITACKGRTADTGDWLLKRSEYIEWRSSSASTILWLHGIPGAGKTKLASRAVDDLRDTFERYRNDEAVAFFYCDRNQSEHRDPVSVTLLVQLYKQKQQSGFPQGELGAEESETILLPLVNVYPQVTIVLDALDECARDTRIWLIKLFDTLVKKSANPVKILISSRPDEDIKDRFKEGSNLEISARENQDDIAKFVVDAIDNSPSHWRKRISMDLRRDIIETLVDKSQGMFQWASLQIRQLLKIPARERDIRDRLGRLPIDLQHAYDEIYTEIESQDGSAKVIAARAFQWVMCSCAPLSAVELVAAVCQDPETDAVDELIDIDIDYVLDVCRNLLVVDQSQFCRFSHLSVQEYLEEHRWSRSQANGLVGKKAGLVL